MFSVKRRNNRADFDSNDREIFLGFLNRQKQIGIIL